MFGEGPPSVSLVLIGEQPGDREDIEGRPFVGPAGRLLDEALVEAGIARKDVYLTNVVKHFKWKPRGKRRIHEKPNSAEITACRPWLEAELALLDPDAIVLLGATAAQTLMGKQFRVTTERGKWLESEYRAKVLATIHPSAILRRRAEKHGVSSILNSFVIWLSLPGTWCRERKKQSLSTRLTSDKIRLDKWKPGNRPPHSLSSS